jgi:hypothetical protein
MNGVVLGGWGCWGVVCVELMVANNCYYAGTRYLQLLPVVLELGISHFKGFVVINIFWRELLSKQAFFGVLLFSGFHWQF